MVMPTFTWGQGGRPVTPEEAARQRKVAEALIGRSQTPAKNWAEGLSQVAGAYTGTVLQDRAAEAEQAGSAEAAALFSGLGSGSNEEAIIAALGNPWANEGQSRVASALLGNKLAQADAPEAPSSVREWEYYNSLPPEQQGQYIRMKRANPYLDIGTGFVQPDPINPGQTSGPAIVKDNFTPAYDSASGTATGKVDVETQAAADSLASKMPGLKSVVAELGDVANKATYTQTGQLWDNIVRETGSMPTEGAVARTKYMAMVDNQVLPLLRDTFGAAFTVQEGESLRATLGAPDKSPIEKQVVLEAFIEQKVRDLEALQSRVDGGSVAPAPTTEGWSEVPDMPGVKIRAK